VNEDAFRGQTLGAMTSNGVAVVEMTMLAGFDSIWRLLSRRAERRPSGWIASIAAMSRFATPSDLSGAVNWTRRLQRTAVDLPIDTDTGETAGIVVASSVFASRP